MTSKEIKIMSDKKYWDEIYYSNLKESEKDSSLIVINVITPQQRRSYLRRVHPSTGCCTSENRRVHRQRPSVSGEPCSSAVRT